ncbi:hypothetical protein HYS94_00850 [Candidatus Daviesbacteria bacterium]|nr:hypothetical protein [Candidatus Daviesbacteria bacterium]
MLLRERQRGIENIYPDSEQLNQTRWAKMLGISISGLQAAMRRGGVETRIVHGRYHPSILTRVEDFPSIIRGLISSRRRRDRYLWPEVDTTKDFQIKARSGAILIYEYPHS